MEGVTMAGGGERKEDDQVGGQKLAGCSQVGALHAAGHTIPLPTHVFTHFHTCRFSSLGSALALAR